MVKVVVSISIYGKIETLPYKCRWRNSLSYHWSVGGPTSECRGGDRGAGAWYSVPVLTQSSWKLPRVMKAENKDNNWQLNWKDNKHRVFKTRMFVHLFTPRRPWWGEFTDIMSYNFTEEQVSLSVNFLTLDLTLLSLDYLSKWKRVAKVRLCFSRNFWTVHSPGHLKMDVFR